MHNNDGVDAMDPRFKRVLDTRKNSRYIAKLHVLNLQLKDTGNLLVLIYIIFFIYLTTHSTHFIYSYMALDIIMVKDHSDSETENFAAATLATVSD